MRLLLLVVFTLLLSYPAVAADTSPFDFAREYIREIVTNERMRALAEKDVTEPNADKMMASIRASTRITLELRSQISVLQRLALSEPKFERLPGMIVQIYEQKIEVNDQIIALSKTFEKASVSGPAPDVDYGALAADAPKLTARNEYIDRMMFEGPTKLIFLMLIDDSKPDKNGHLSRLVITRAQRDQLIASLQSGFGKKMDKKGDQGYFVASGTVLRDMLLKNGYKCADEPM
jgi:hypothetical protein